MSSPGLRERKKRATMHDLAVASYELVRERGLDAVTVDDVVERAGYSRRTFANHYTCKQEAVVDGFTLRMRLLTSGSEEPGPPLHGSLGSMIDTMQAQVTAVFTGPALDHVQDFAAVLRADRSLAPYLAQAFERDFDAALTPAMTRELGVETATLLLGTIAGQMLALMRLATGTDPDRMAGLVEQAFDHVRHGFGPRTT